MRVYFSISIAGGEDPDLRLAQDIIEMLKKLGHEVLSEHVVLSGDLLKKVFLENAAAAGFDIENMDLPALVRAVDTYWVDQAEALVAVVNRPSFGVGMEIERALLKPRLGLDRTPVLALLRWDLFDKTSKMITGIRDENFRLYRYKSAPGAKRAVNVFLKKISRSG